MKLLVATRNAHKLDEILAIFSLPGLQLLSMRDIPDLPDVVEDGVTFEANASKKAMTLACHTGLWALGDDSGLEVDALNGAPGVYSARYAGEPVNYSANNAKLLAQLAGQSNRRARFRCVLALAEPAGTCLTLEGRCEGHIAEAPRGTHGFGYDPLFVPEGSTLTFAEMSATDKNRRSHRGAALQRAASEWRDLLRADCGKHKRRQ